MMKQQLEVQHLAPYLPYKLRGFGLRHIHQLEAVSIERQDGYWVQIDSFQTFGRWGAGQIKPMLHPLSLLLEDEVFEQMEIDLAGKISDAIHQWIKYALSDHANIDNAILSAPYPVIEWALDKHYDIFSLISKDLAVPLT